MSILHFTDIMNGPDIIQKLNQAHSAVLSKDQINTLA